MDTVTELPFCETVRLDGERLGRMICKLDPRDAEDMVGRAIEELAIRLSRCEAARRDHDYLTLRGAVRALIGLADQLGMTALDRAAGHVIDSIDQGDHIAVAATLARVIRIGDVFLNTVWDIEGLSV